MLGGHLEISGPLVQMRPHRVEAVVLAEASIEAIGRWNAMCALISSSVHSSIGVQLGCRSGPPA